MTKKTRRDAKNLRSAHNSDLVRRMRNGENLTSFDSHSSWFPPRPVIEKDKSDLVRLFSDKAHSEKSEPVKLESIQIDGEKVVALHRKTDNQDFEPMDDAS
jgi:hypothetical protein